MTIGERIKKTRENRNISQTDLAKKIGVSKQSLYKYEMNIVTNIPSNIIEQIAAILDISPCYLMGWENKEPPKEDSPGILQYYNLLNNVGRHVATERVKELTEVSRYVEKKTPEHLVPIAAHNDFESEEELAKMQEDIANLKIPE